MRIPRQSKLDEDMCKGDHKINKISPCSIHRARARATFRWKCWERNTEKKRIRRTRKLFHGRETRQVRETRFRRRHPLGETKGRCCSGSEYARYAGTRQSASSSSSSSPPPSLLSLRPCRFVYRLFSLSKCSRARPISGRDRVKIDRRARASSEGDTKANLRGWGGFSPKGPIVVQLYTYTQYTAAEKHSR